MLIAKFVDERRIILPSPRFQPPASVADLASTSTFCRAPPLGRSCIGVFVVPVPPLVRRGLRVALRRVLPLLLAPERSHVEVAPGAPHRLVAAAVDEVGAEHAGRRRG